MVLPTLFSAGAAATTLLALLPWADLVLAHPSFEERAPAHRRWSIQRGRKFAGDVHRDVSKSPSHDSSKTTACNTSQSNTISAPYDNVWAGLSDQEAVAVVSWLFGQKRLNLTAAEDAGEWDNKV